MRRPVWKACFLMATGALWPTGTGCGALRPLAYLFAPPQVQKAEFKLTEGRLAVVIDFARPGQVDPVFETNLYDRIVRHLRDHGVKTQVIPYEEVIRLRQATPDYRTWSVQRIGRRLEADQVLYIRVEDLRLGGPEDPVMHPAVELHVKVVGVHEPAVHSRLWPKRDAEPDGRVITHKRPPVERSGAERNDTEVARLARETAFFVARHFFSYDTEQLPPREP